MSSQRSEKITCPGCGKEHDFEMWNSLNTMLDPDMKEKLLSKEMFQFICPNCGYTANVDYGFLYHQMEDRIMIYYIQDVNVNTHMYKKWNILMYNNGITHLLRESPEAHACL